MDYQCAKCNQVIGDFLKFLLHLKQHPRIQPTEGSK
jgi:hypothetical protein